MLALQSSALNTLSHHSPTQPPSPSCCAQLGELHDTEMWLRTKKLGDLSSNDMRQLKQRGFSDSQIARAVGSDMMTGALRCVWRAPGSWADGSE